MGKFEQTGWGQPEYSREYRDNSENYIQERRTMLRILSSYYRCFIGTGGEKRVLDLGCGDGIIAEMLCAQDGRARIVVADGSEEMLKAARERLAGLPIFEFRRITFEELIAGGFVPGEFDFIVSGLAIHHLHEADKEKLFSRVFEMLGTGGHFLNMDVATSPHDPYVDWYYGLWKDWIRDRESGKGTKESFAHVPDRARKNPENCFDPLQSQLGALSRAGFAAVECHYRHGLFAIYGGRKP